MKTLMSATDVAAHVGIKPSTVKRWARQGRIPSMRLTDRVVRFDPEAVEKALAKRSINERRLEDD